MRSASWYTCKLESVPDQGDGTVPPTVSVMIATYNAGRCSLTPWMRSPPRASLRSGSRSSLSTMVQRMARGAI